MRVKNAHLNPALDPRQPGFPDRYVYAFWHEVLLLPAHLFGRPDIDCHVLISKHADGQLIAETAERLGFKTVRGSSSRGGTEAVRELMKTKTSQIAVTPDGPRGPRRVVQPGMIYLASRTGLPMVAVGFASDRPWRAKSWDQFALPRPFHRAVCSFHGPLHVPADADRDTLEKYRLLFQSMMEEAQAHAEATVEGRVAPLAQAA